MININYVTGSRTRRKFLKLFLNEHVRHKRKLATVCTKFHCKRFSGLEESTVQLNKMYIGVKITNPTEHFKTYNYCTSRS